VKVMNVAGSYFNTEKFFENSLLQGHREDGELEFRRPLILEDTERNYLL
jgi:hypothetical protein